MSEGEDEMRLEDERDSQGLGLRTSFVDEIWYIFVGLQDEDQGEQKCVHVGEPIETRGGEVHEADGI